MQRTPLTAYQRSLLVFLGVASFFEGYDFLTLTQILPELRADPSMNLSKSAAAWLIAVINLGTMLAYFLVRGADRWGRRNLLSTTIAGYTLSTLASGLAPGPVTFALAQLSARAFLVAEWAVSLIFAAEEFPAERRGMAIGTINAFSSLGSIVCAGLMSSVLRLGNWRTAYFIGVVPLVLLAWARRSLKETARFEGARVEGRTPKVEPISNLFAIWGTPYRLRLVRIGLIWFFMYVCAQNAVTFWKDFAVSERGLSTDDVSACVRFAALVALPLSFVVGPAIDRIGRKPGAVVVFAMLSGGVAGAYFFYGTWPLTLSLMFAIAGTSAVLPVLNAFNAEMFPTELRGDAVAWGNNIIGRIGYVLSPIIVGSFADKFGWGPAVRATTVFPLVSLALILVWMPETRARELEETAGL